MTSEWLNKWASEWIPGAVFWYTAIEMLSLRCVSYPIWQSSEKSFENVAQAISSREACETRSEWSPEDRVLWWVKVDSIAFLCFSGTLPEAKILSPLLWPFYKSSEGLWSILVVKKLNKCNPLITHCMGLHPAWAESSILPAGQWIRRGNSQHRKGVNFV